MDALLFEIIKNDPELLEKLKHKVHDLVDNLSFTQVQEETMTEAITHIFTNICETISADDDDLYNDLQGIISSKLSEVLTKGLVVKLKPTK